MPSRVLSWSQGKSSDLGDCTEKSSYRQLIRTFSAAKISLSLVAGEICTAIPGASAYVLHAAAPYESRGRGDWGDLGGPFLDGTSALFWRVACCPVFRSSDGKEQRSSLVVISTSKLLNRSGTFFAL